VRRRVAFALGIPAALLAAGGLLFLVLCGGEVPGGEINPVGRAPAIHPDFSGITVPPNVAPLNFRIEEDGSRFYVKIHSREGQPLEVLSHTGKIIIPRGPWRRLLEANRGGELHLDVYAKEREGLWKRFDSITNRIAREDIDGYLAYRRMHPTRSPWSMSIRCRDLAGFGEDVVLGYRVGFEGGCMNCHTPLRNDPNTMLMGFRGRKLGTGTLLVDGGEAKKIGRKFGYTSWHPGGKVAAYSVNDLPIFFHTARSDLRDTIDKDSYIAYYLVDTKTTKPCPQLARKDRLENWPVWSADGRHLYYCAAPKLWKKPVGSPPERYQEVRYSLERIGYDAETDQWGRMETVLSAAETGKSIAMPRISPDGRWLSFCMFDHGFFPNWQEESDLYLVDLRASEKSGKYEYRRMELSSDRSESWHSWSLNGRWIVFTSKREYGIFTRLYFSHVDEAGRAHKPFVLPQEDPGFYDSCLDGFNTPELLVRPVPVGRGTLDAAVRGSDEIVVDGVSMPTPKAEQPRQASWMWE
jgi:Tol biopolymer transport system component